MVSSCIYFAGCRCCKPLVRVSRRNYIDCEKKERNGGTKCKDEADIWRGRQQALLLSNNMLKRRKSMMVSRQLGEKSSKREKAEVIRA